MEATLHRYLPAFWAKLLPEVMSLAVPVETRATCHDCAMCVPPDAALPEAFQTKSFSPITKCCTYHPSLCNFLVGGILSTETEGSRRLGEKIRRGVGVIPRGVVAPRKFWLLYDNSFGTFGRAEKLKCEFYDDGACTVWEFREATCATWFCKFERGKEGRQFWDDVKRYVATFELKLSLYAISQIINDGDQLGRIWDTWDQKGTLTAADIDEVPPPESERRGLWGEWLGREEEFYRRCFEIVSALTPEEARGLIGAEEPLFRRKLEAQHARATSDALPPRLLRNPELAVLKHEDHYLCAPRPGETFEIHGAFYPLLEYFDGKIDNDAVCAKIATEKKLTIPKELLSTLFHRGVLIAG